jgi:hypothetical protein
MSCARSRTTHLFRHFTHHGTPLKRTRQHLSIPQHTLAIRKRIHHGIPGCPVLFLYMTVLHVPRYRGMLLVSGCETAGANRFSLYGHAPSQRPCRRQGVRIPAVSVIPKKPAYSGSFRALFSDQGFVMMPFCVSCPAHTRS